MVCQLAYAPTILVHVVGLAPTKDNQVRLIYSQVPLLLSHTCASEFQISNLDDRDFKFEIHLC
jgi:hypothetical protein